MNAPAISANRLSKQFGDNQAVDNVDLSIPAGSIYGFLGPNGAGKSTAVKMLVTLLGSTSGSAEVAGLDVQNDIHNLRLKIGVALQEAALDDQQTGRELLQTQGGLYGLDRNTTDRRIDELESLIDIGTALDQRIKTYSGGMKRRVDLAAALIHNPEVLFLDEPTTGLDPSSRNKVWREIERLNQDLGMTIFLTTQYLEEADALANKIGIINKGKIVAEDTPANLKRQLGNEVVFVETESKFNSAEQLQEITDVTEVKQDGSQLTIYTRNGGQVLAPIISLLDQAGVKIVDVELRKPTLDDVFLNVTETGNE